MENSPRATGLVALVTGASRGIGAAIARRLAAEGAEVGLIARSMDEHPPHLPGTLRQTALDIRDLGGRAVPIAGDLSDGATRRRILEDALGRLGRIDILVNNASAAYHMPFERYSEKRYRIAFELNVRAPFDLAQALLPGMRQRQRGWILNISASSAGHPRPEQAEELANRGGGLLYDMTKAALDRFTTGLAAEVSGQGISVNSLAPVSLVRTPGTEALGLVDDPRARIEPLEVMVEAALALCTTPPGVISGRVVTTRDILTELGIAPRTLDGAAEYVS